MQYHELANLFPMISGSEADELALDIGKNGLREPIVTFEGKILDGRNRFEACMKAGVQPVFVEYNGDDPLAFVVSLNLKRRHLNESQRGMVAAKIATLTHGGDRRSDQAANLPVVTQAKAAEMLNVSERTVRTASKVEQNAAPELIRAVDSGAVSVSAAADVAELPKEEQAEIVAKGEKAILEAAKEIRAQTREKKRVEIIARLESIEARQAKELVGEYDVIVIDPPWPMQKIERDVRPNQSEFDYPVMSEQEMSEMKLPAAADCHLWMWTTHKFLPMGLRLLDAWQFKYVCTFVWHKPGGFQPIGLPQYNCEFALYARRGAPQFIDTKAFPVCFNAARGAHSEKPEEFYEVVRRVTAGRRIDIFNRRAIDGFDVWGNEASG